MCTNVIQFFVLHPWTCSAWKGVYEHKKASVHWQPAEKNNSFRPDRRPLVKWETLDAILNVRVSIPRDALRENLCTETRRRL